jgi:hypothetical protein
LAAAAAGPRQQGGSKRGSESGAEGACAAVEGSKPATATAQGVHPGVVGVGSAGGVVVGVHSTGSQQLSCVRSRHVWGLPAIWAPASISTAYVVRVCSATHHSNAWCGKPPWGLVLSGWARCCAPYRVCCPARGLTGRGVCRGPALCWAAAVLGLGEGDPCSQQGRRGIRAAAAVVAEAVCGSEPGGFLPGAPRRWWHAA